MTVQFHYASTMEVLPKGQTVAKEREEKYGMPE